MKIKTVVSLFQDTSKFDKEVNLLLDEGWQIHDLQSHGGSGSMKYVAFMVKED